MGIDPGRTAMNKAKMMWGRGASYLLGLSPRVTVTLISVPFLRN